MRVNFGFRLFSPTAINPRKVLPETRQAEAPKSERGLSHFRSPFCCIPSEKTVTNTIYRPSMKIDELPNTSEKPVSADIQAFGSEEITEKETSECSLPGNKQQNTPTIPIRLSDTFLQKNPRILIADDSNVDRKLAVRVATTLEFSPGNIVTATNGPEALTKYIAAAKTDAPFSVVFSDRSMGTATDGDTLAYKLYEAGYKTPFVLISGTPPDELPQGIGLICQKGDTQYSQHIRSYLEPL
jgi:CheY-like chemotaxis protein